MVPDVVDQDPLILVLLLQSGVVFLVGFLFLLYELKFPVFFIDLLGVLICGKQQNVDQKQAHPCTDHPDIVRVGQGLSLIHI